MPPKRLEYGSSCVQVCKLDYTSLDVDIEVKSSGPYINAETTAGGIAHWATSKVAGTLRSNATDYHDAWQDYIAAMSKLAEPNQITKGGPIIGEACFSSRKKALKEA